MSGGVSSWLLAVSKRYRFEKLSYSNSIDITVAQSSSLAQCPV